MFTVLVTVAIDGNLSTLCHPCSSLFVVPPLHLVEFVCEWSVHRIQRQHCPPCAPVEETLMQLWIHDSSSFKANKLYQVPRSYFFWWEWNCSVCLCLLLRSPLNSGVSAPVCGARDAGEPSNYYNLFLQSNNELISCNCKRRVLFSRN